MSLIDKIHLTLMFISTKTILTQKKKTKIAITMIIIKELNEYVLEKSIIKQIKKIVRMKLD